MRLRPIPFRIRISSTSLVLLFALCGAATEAKLLPSNPTTAAGDLVLWYQQPGNDQKTNEASHARDDTSTMTRGLPVGNGRLGGLILGAPGGERIVLDEISLWTGNENSSGDYDNMGSYQFLGDLLVNLPGQENATDYWRDLDLGQALAHVSYAVKGVKYRREYFCSHPAGVMALKFSADKPGSYTGSLELKDSHAALTVVAGNEMAFAGALNNGLKYECRMLLLPDGGSVATNGSAVELKKCNGFTLLLTAGTDYAMDYAKHFRGDDPHAAIV